jgi:glucuronokinase
MELIETAAYARVGLAGNPSDGYFGKTLSVVVRDFSARVVLYEWPTLEILPQEQDLVHFNNLDELAQDVRLNGYYGGLRLVKASLKKFHDYCMESGVTIPSRNFAIRYGTNVPRQVGLAGSSAIIAATFRALMRFYKIDIPPQELPNWVLATEKDELRITGGLQDRVCQTYESLVYMDFAQEKMERDGYGEYEKLNPELLPPLYLAYQTRLSEMSDVVHNDLAERWKRGDKEVVAAMHRFAELAEEAKACLLAGNAEQLGEIMDANFDLRRSIIPISDDNLEMVEIARSCGVSAKFAGSGGAIVGICPSHSACQDLTQKLSRIGCRVIRPRVVE